MPVKARAAKDRRPSFDRRTFALFFKLEGMSQDTREFKDGSHELARLLGLTDAWWTGNSVLDRSLEPCWPTHCVAFGDWHRCRAVRTALLLEAARAHAGAGAPSGAHPAA